MKQLLVNVESIKEAAQPWEAELSREFIDEVLLADPPTEYHAGGSATARAKLTKMGRKVLVQSAFQVPLTGQCKRCLKPVQLAEAIELTLTYLPREGSGDGSERESAHPAGKAGAAAEEVRGSARRKRRDPDEPEGSIELDLPDEERYAGSSFDLAPALREQILLSVPASPVCREDCKGLCPVCGKDLNEAECGCDRADQDPRWDALKAIKLDLPASKSESKPASKPVSKKEK